MIEANQPNACNLCHLDQPIGWTIDHLRNWYGNDHRYSAIELKRNYSSSDQPVGLGWLRSDHAPTRLVAADTLARHELPAYVSELLEVLMNDDNTEIRRFTQRRIEEKLELAFKKHGYEFHQSKQNRRAAIERIREDIETKAAAAE